MPSLTIMRHGRADEALGLADHERPLTVEGREELSGVAAGLGALGVSPTLILSSPYRRTVETARGIAMRLSAPRGGERGGAGESGEQNVQTLPELAPAAAPLELVLESIIEAVRLAEDARSILVVGHLPDVSYLTGLIIAGQSCRAVDFAPATAAHLACLGSIRSGGGTLLWALRAEALVRLGG